MKALKPRGAVKQHFNASGLLFVFIFVAAGTILLFVTHAATSSSSSEAENGTLNGVSTVTDTNASGGKAIKFGGSAANGTIPTQTTSHLPIDLPTQAWLKQGITSGTQKRLVFAHYFTQFPLSENNTGDYYATSYLPPNGEGGAHSTYGGYLRERPLPVGYTATSTYLLDDAKTEVTRATQAGLDGFTMDMLSLDPASYHWTRMLTMIDAAQKVDPNFKIMLMPDAWALRSNTYQAFADSIATLENDSTKKNGLFHLPDGRLVVAPFGPETEGATYWKSFVDYMKSAHNITVAFVPCFIGRAIDNTSFKAFSYGMSDWGNRSPGGSASLASEGTTIHGLTNSSGANLIWMQPVSYQDERPSSKVYAESQNGDNYRTTWGQATSTNAEWIQIPTWNDYSEGAEIAPSSHHGFSLLDLTSYYLTRFKMGGQNPPIVRDVIYLNHRIQLANATVTGESAPMVLGLGSSTTRDDVEIDTFLTAAATVTVKVGSNTYTYNAPAGASFQTYPLAAGTFSATVTRNGTATASATSPYSMTTGSVTIQDEHYHYVSSVASRNPPAGY